MNITTVIAFILLIVFTGIIISLVYWTLRLGISPTPTSPKVKHALQSLLPATVSGEIHELGSGWGNLLSTIHAQYPHHSLIAHERSPIPRYFSILISRLFKTEATITGHNIFDVDLSEAGLIICYLYPGAMTKLSKHFETVLPDNCWVISHTFHIPDWKLVQTLKASDIYKTPIYLYRKKPL